jgi:hypothetical protein
MATMRPWKSALTWDLKNLLVHAFVPASQRVCVRYERFSSEPTRELDRIFAFAETGTTPNRTRATVPSTFTSKPFHTLGGNRVRFTRGMIDVRADTKWRAEMPLVQKIIVTCLTSPLLVAYGYLDVPWVRGGDTISRRVRRRRPKGGDIESEDW